MATESLNWSLNLETTMLSNSIFSYSEQHSLNRELAAALRVVITHLPDGHFIGSRKIPGEREAVDLVDVFVGRTSGTNLLQSNWLKASKQHSA